MESHKWEACLAMTSRSLRTLEELKTDIYNLKLVIKYQAQNIKNLQFIVNLIAQEACPDLIQELNDLFNNSADSSNDQIYTEGNEKTIITP